MRRGGLAPCLLLVHLSLLAGPFASEAGAQDVVDLLRYERSVTRSGELLREMGGRIEARPLADLSPASIYLLWHDRIADRRRRVADSLAAVAAQARADSLAALPPTLEIETWTKVEPDAQGPFLGEYGEAYWVAAPRLAALDTVGTSQLRARLNGLFGAPTRNAAAAEQEGYAGSEFVQFEYWLVVNDTIPLLVLDRDGPFGRGLILAGDEAYREVLPLLTADLARRLDGARPTPYADYYHAFEQRQWFRTGFDGETYFTEETRAPRWASRRARNERWRIFR
ncbi:MAG: hypothetical protein R3181_02155 [Rubricoccaceae bacterium]|nr:hypothetical protein [Rubricoccaceae bacterium]